MKPGFARALAAKGSAYVILSNYSDIDHGEAMRLARRYTEEALALDDQLAEATAVLANLTSADGDQLAALKLYERAVNLDPTSVSAQQWYGGFLTMMGYLKEGRKHIEIAYELEPLSGSTSTTMALHAAIAGDRLGVQKYAGIAGSVGAVRAHFFAGLAALSDGDAEKATHLLGLTYKARGRQLEHLPAVVRAGLRAHEASSDSNRDPDSRATTVAADLLQRFDPALLDTHEHLYMEWALIGAGERALEAVLANKPPLLSATLWLPETGVLRRQPYFFRRVGKHHGFEELWERKGLPDLCRESSGGSVACE